MNACKSLIVLFLVAMWLSGCATVKPPGYQDVPLPDLIHIVAPDPGLASRIRAFSGKWAGTWDTGRNAILIVERIDPGGNRAEVIYALGRDIGRTGNWNRYQAVIEGDVLAFQSAVTPNAFQFKLKGEDVLEGTMSYKSKRSGISQYKYITMQRID